MLYIELILLVELVCLVQPWRDRVYGRRLSRRRIAEYAKYLV